MDEERFDTLARIIGNENTAPRRTALKAAAGSVLGVAALLTRDAAPLPARRRKGKRRPDTVTVCHSGKTLRVPRHAVHAVLLKGGSRGACTLNEEPPPATGGPAINVRMVIENLTAANVDFEGWISTSPPIRDCRLVELQSLAPNNAIPFDPNSPWLFAVIYFDPNDHVEPYLINASQGIGDPFPAVILAQGGRIERDRCSVGFQTDVERDLGVGQKFTRTIKGRQIEISRESDFNGERLIRVRLLS
jgi:hypothetical protein